MVSIHAPVKGATIHFCPKLHLSTCFNSRSREGSDHLRPKHLQTELCFNSRSREGSDWDQNNAYNTPYVSIHAPVKGATRVSFGNIFFNLFFNSRSLEGSDFKAGASLDEICVSIHAPVKGATLTFCALTPM